MQERLYYDVILLYVCVFIMYYALMVCMHVRV